MTIKMIKKAEEFATLAHEGQKRKGGKDVPYITHPLAVAEILQSRLLQRRLSLDFSTMSLKIQTLH